MRTIFFRKNSLLVPILVIVLTAIDSASAFGFSANPSRQEIINYYDSAVVKIERHKIGGKKDELGSGFFVSPTTILTNAHVVGELPENAEKLLDIYSNTDVAHSVFWVVHAGKRYRARFVGRDPDVDLARLEIRNEIPGTTVAILGNSDNVKVGDQVLVFGSPMGMENSVTGGIISGKHRIISVVSYEDYLQTDAAVNPGNSGGPLVDLKSGEVVGITNSRLPSTNNMGFAIPINIYRETEPELFRTIKHSWIGVEFSLENMEDSEGFQGLQAIYNLTGVNDIAILKKIRKEVFKDGGVLISDVMRKEFNYFDPTASGAVEASRGERVQPPASKAGLEIGDVVKKLGPYPITKSRDLLYALFKSKPYESITAVIVRFDEDGKRTERNINIVPILRNPAGVKSGFH